MGDKDETVKDQVLKAMATLPDDATFEDVIELVCLLMDIDIGLKQITPDR